MKIRVSNIDRSTSEDELYGLFEEFGDVVSIELNEQPDPGVDTFSAMVEMEYTDDAEDAIQELNGEWVDGNALRVVDGSHSDATDTGSSLNGLDEDDLAAEGLLKLKPEGDKIMRRPKRSR